MRTALICVDVQSDFISGALAVPEGDEIIAPMLKLAPEMDLVIASRDWHPKNHFSFLAQGGTHPAHCVQDTPGARINSKVRKAAHYVVAKGMEPDKDAYSAFVAQTLRPKRSLPQILKEQEIERVIVGGLAMDLCVKWTALDLAASGYITIVGQDITRALTAEGEQEALEAFRRAGIQVQNVGS
jgi:nicotinamidase/pyrazinamidase